MNFPNALGWTLIHFLWEGVLIAGLYATAQEILRRRSANLRYLAGCAAMLCMLMAPIVTLISLASHRAARMAHLPAAGARGWQLSDCFPLLIGGWLAGVVLLSVWSAGGWVMAMRLRRKSRRPIPNEWRTRMAELSRRMGIDRTVRVFQTTLADVPMVVGWLRPVILIPVCSLVNLNVLQLEALLAHELAHIRRHDYLVNLMQTAIETLLFYHPAVWWLGNRIRDERENCCDDIAVTVCGSVHVYASALANLEESRIASVRLAMAASNGSLLDRVRRLVPGQQPAPPRTPGWLPALVITFAIVMVLAGSTPRQQSRKGHSNRPAAQVDVAVHGGSFVLGVAAAGYLGISVDDIIALKENGVSPQYMESITKSGIGRPSPADLIKLHANGVNASDIGRALEFGMESLPVDRLVQLKQSGILNRERSRQ